MKNEVSMSVKKTVILRAETAPKFTIQSKGKKLGELVVSQGGLEWWPRSAKAFPTSITWEKFAALAAGIVKKKAHKSSKRKDPTSSLASQARGHYSKNLRRPLKG